MYICGFFFSIFDKFIKSIYFKHKKDAQINIPCKLRPTFFLIDPPFSCSQSIGQTSLFLFQTALSNCGFLLQSGITTNLKSLSTSSSFQKKPQYFICSGSLSYTLALVWENPAPCVELPPPLTVWLAGNPKLDHVHHSNHCGPSVF